MSFYGVVRLIIYLQKLGISINHENILDFKRIVESSLEFSL